MIRRTAAVALALVAALSLSACATFTDNTNAARVGDAELSRADLERYLADVLEARNSAADSAAVSEEFPGDVHRAVITGWIVDEMIRQFLVEQGQQVTEADRETATRVVDEQSVGRESTVFVRDYDINSAATRAAYQRVAPAEGALLAFAEEADVYVDPVYGYWDLERASVIPMSS